MCTHCWLGTRPLLHGVLVIPGGVNRKVASARARRACEGMERSDFYHEVPTIDANAASMDFHDHGFKSFLRLQLYRNLLSKLSPCFVANTPFIGVR